MVFFFRDARLLTNLSESSWFYLVCSGWLGRAIKSVIAFLFRVSRNSYFTYILLLDPMQLMKLEKHLWMTKKYNKNWFYHFNAIFSRDLHNITGDYTHSCHNYRFFCPKGSLSMNVKEICTYFGLRGKKWEHFIMQGYMISTPIKENEMGGACGMYGGEVRSGFWWGNASKRGHSCRRADNTKTNLEDIGKEDFNLIILAQDGPRGRVIKTR
jgi:hypothetical protein